MILTVKEISGRLSGQAEPFARWIFPNGKKVGGEWRVGSINGEAGDSLGIRLSGTKAGVFCDFASDTERGDLLDLICQVRNVSLREAVQIAKEWLGIKDEFDQPKRSYSKPKPAKPVNGSIAVQEYLALKREIDCWTQAKFKVYQHDDPKNGPEIVFQSFSPEGELINRKYLAVNRDERGKKIIRQEVGCAPSMFGWQAIPKNTREIIITEGEIDCMTWYQMGFPALSVPDGASGDTWIDYEWENLILFDTIWLAYDDDDSGRNGASKIARRLGHHRCLLLKPPNGAKDANEALQKGATLEDFQKAVAAAKPIVPKAIKTPAELKQVIRDEFNPPNGVEAGFFPALFGGRLGLRPGEVTVWTGIAGHGKSVLLTQVMLEAIMAGYRVAIASMEMPIRKTLRQMLRQAEMEATLPGDVTDELLDWLTGKLWLYDLLGNVSPRTLMDLLEYSFARNNVTMFVVDSLTKCSIDSDDYNAQRMFLNELCSFCLNTGSHVNLVAHSRKGRDESDAPGKLDVRGSGDIIMQPANLLSIWRNKEKEEKARNGMVPSDLDPDTFVYCSKQRETGIEFTAKLRFSPLYHGFSLMNGSLPSLSIWNILHPQPITQDLL